MINEDMTKETLNESARPLVKFANIDLIIDTLPNYCMNDLLKLQESIDQEIINRASPVEYYGKLKDD